VHYAQILDAEGSNWGATVKPFTVDGEAVEVKTTFAVPFNFNNY
jgi:hypothetical protein